MHNRTALITQVVLPGEYSDSKATMSQREKAGPGQQEKWPCQHQRSDSGGRSLLRLQPGVPAQEASWLPLLCTVNVNEEPQRV